MNIFHLVQNVIFLLYWGVGDENHIVLLHLFTCKKDRQIILHNFVTFPYMCTVQYCSELFQSGDSTEGSTMAATEPVVLNEKGEDEDKNLDADEIAKKLRVSITNLKGSYMSEDGSKVDYSKMSRSPKFEEYCNIAALLKFIKPESFNEEKVKLSTQLYDY